MRDLKFVHAGSDIRRDEVGGKVVWRVEVLVGSNAVSEGVMRAFRFCVMESSMVERDRRRKSVVEEDLAKHVGAGGADWKGHGGNLSTS